MLSSITVELYSVSKGGGSGRRYPVGIFARNKSGTDGLRIPRSAGAKWRNASSFPGKRMRKKRWPRKSGLLKFLPGDVHGLLCPFVLVCILFPTMLLLSRPLSWRLYTLANYLNRIYFYSTPIHYLGRLVRSFVCYLFTQLEHHHRKRHCLFRQYKNIYIYFQVAHFLLPLDRNVLFFLKEFPSWLKKA